MRRIFWAAALCWVGIGLMPANAETGGNNIPGGAFFFTSPLTPDELSDERPKSLSGYVVAKVYLLKVPRPLPRPLEKIKHMEDRYEIELQVAKIYGESDITTGTYLSIIGEESQIMFHGPLNRIFPPPITFDVKHILYCLIRKDKNGQLVIARRRFQHTNRF